MLKESFAKDDGDAAKLLQPATLIVLALATSIDALVVGFTFIFIDVNLPLAVALIGGVTFAAGLLGMYLGHKGTHILEAASSR